MSPAEEVKSRLDIVEVVREYVSDLKPAGANFKGRCPFHEERSASFMVSKSKQMWHCFGCNEGGDVFTFVMKEEGIEFPDALRLLAEKAGVRLRQEDPGVRTERQRLQSLLEAAADFWATTLWEGDTAREARRYLQDDRHLLPETVRAWRLGCAIDSWDSLVNHLGAVGFTEEEMVKAGLAVHKMATRGRSVYDRFRNRLMFPISNAQGQIIGFTGRTLSTAPNSTEAKYVNTPETLLYHKGSVLYGLDKAKNEIRKQDLVVLVEGNVDVMTSHQAGVSNVVAASGTALTEDQLRTLQRYTEHLAFCFDADAAGETATLRGLFAALAAGADVSLITLPPRADGGTYKDPDELIREKPEAWAAAIAARQSVMEHYFARLMKGRDLSKLADKQAITKFLLPIIGRLPDPVTATHYLQKLAAAVSVPEKYLREALAKAVPATPNKAQPATPAPKPTPTVRRDGRTIQSERLVAALIRLPKELGFVAEQITPEVLDPSQLPLYREMIVFYTAHQSTDWQNAGFIEQLNMASVEGSALNERLALATLLADREFADLDDTEVRRELLSTIKRLKDAYIRSKLVELQRQLSDQPNDANLLQEFHTWTRKRADLDI